MTRRNLILFGAGASYGSKSIYPKQPPLGKDLFDELSSESRVDKISMGHFWGAIKNSQNHSFYEENFEPAYQKIIDNWGGNYELHTMAEMALYFSEFKVKSHSENIYSLFVKALKEETDINSIVFSSLNYDCIFEDVLEHFQYQFNYCLDEKDMEAILFYKLHGSCNFIPNKNNISISIANISSSVQKGINAPLGFIAPKDASKYYGCDRSMSNLALLYPVMSFYTKNKQAGICQNGIKNIQNKWKSEFESLENIFLIGVSPALHDEYVWEPILHSKAKIHYYYLDEHEAQQIRNVRGNNIKFIQKDFEHSYEEIVSIISRSQS